MRGYGEGSAAGQFELSVHPMPAPDSSFRLKSASAQDNGQQSFQWSDSRSGLGVLQGFIDGLSRARDGLHDAPAIVELTESDQ